MTELELKEEIEKTRNVLNMAVRERWGSGKVMEIRNQKMVAGQ